MDATLEAALISTVVSAVVSFLTNFLSIRFGPNYKREIADLNAALTRVFEEQSRVTELMEARFSAEREAEKQRAQREQDSQWRPTARIELRAWDDTRLILKGDREFLVENVTLLSANGASLAEIPLSRSGMAVKSTGFAIQVPQSEIVKVSNDSPGPRTGQMQATVRVVFSTGNSRRTLELPVMGKQEFVTVAPSTTQGYIRLIG